MWLVNTAIYLEQLFGIGDQIISYMYALFTPNSSNEVN